MNIQSASYHGCNRNMGASSHSVLSRDAPPGISQETWDKAQREERLGLIQASIQIAASSNNQGASRDGFWGTGTHGCLISGTSSGMAPVLLAESRKIFNEYPARLSVEWEFTKSPLTEKGGASDSLAKKLTKHGIKHNLDEINKAPDNSVTDRSKGIGTLNNTNGRRAEYALAKELEKEGYRVNKQVTIDTPLGERRVDIVATKNEGGPLFSEKRLIESKQGEQSLPKVAQDNNVRMQIEKDAAILTEHKTKAPIPHVVGRIFYAVGHVARPVGIILGTLEINQAYQMDGNRFGIHTAEKVARIGGAAGGAYAGTLGGGALLGMAIGSWFPGVGTVVGAVVGGSLGFFVGGIGGGMLGEYAASGIFNKVKNWLFPKP